jgi:DNA-binding IclR family transcriptional regulator
MSLALALILGLLGGFCLGVGSARFLRARAINHEVRVLHLFKQTRLWVDAAEVSRQTGISRYSAGMILMKFEALGVLDSEGRHRRGEQGTKLYRWSQW